VPADGRSGVLRLRRSAMSWDRDSSAHARGYGRRWMKLRAQILDRDRHLCQCPRCQGGKVRVRPATQVDHVLPRSRGGTDDPSNLRAVNADCHQRITAEQNGKRWLRRELGPDGWPID
jgi:5-methylcytosine-specific restriction protein A